MPLFQLFVDICLLRRGPQDLPADRRLAVLVAGAYFAVGVVVLYPSEGVARALGSALLDLLLLLVLLRVALSWRRHPARFVQAASALTGTGALLGLLLLPVVGLGDGDPDGQALAGLLWLGVFAWSLVVTGHVLRQALDLPLAGGVLAAVLYVAVSLVVLDLVFPRMA